MQQFLAYQLPRRRRHALHKSFGTPSESAWPLLGFPSMLEHRLNAFNSQLYSPDNNK
jgi:hypothetical protein